MWLLKTSTFPFLISNLECNGCELTSKNFKEYIIKEIDGTKVISIFDVSKLITMSTSEFIDFKVSRYDQEILLKVKPNMVESEDNLGNKINKRIVGIKLSPPNNN